MGDETQGETEAGSVGFVDGREVEIYPERAGKPRGLCGGAASNLSVSLRCRVGCHGRKDLSGQRWEQRDE